jgi:hypothetical protein
MVSGIHDTPDTSFKTPYIYIFPISCTTVTINYYCCTGSYTRGSSDSPGAKWAIMDGKKVVLGSSWMERS